jgi:hypothetical protein
VAALIENATQSKCQYRNSAWQHDTARPLHPAMNPNHGQHNIPAPCQQQDDVPIEYTNSTKMKGHNIKFIEWLE